MAKLPSVRRLASLSTALLIVLSVLVFVPTPAVAVQVSQSVVVNPNPADWTPMIEDGQVNAILQVGTKVIVGGTFTQVRRANTSAFLTRNYLFAFDMNTGVIDPNFVPILNRSVEALALGPDGSSVFVGGDFSTVNGLSYKKVVRLNIADGSIVTAFKANASALVQDLVARGDWLYVSGKFTTIKSTARSGVARLDPNTGNVDADFDLPFTNPLRGTLGVPEIDVSPDGSNLVAIGSFSKVAGLDRVQIAMLDVGVTPAVVSSWQTSDFPVFVQNSTTTWCSGSFRTYMRDVDIAPDGSYFVVATTGAFRANRLCDTATRWELGTTRSQPTSDVGGLERRRYLLEHQRHRHRDLRRRPLPLVEQPLPRGHRRTGCCRPGGHRRPGPDQRAPVQLEPEPRTRRGDLHDAGHGGGIVGGQ